MTILLVLSLKLTLSLEMHNLTQLGILLSQVISYPSGKVLLLPTNQY